MTNKPLYSLKRRIKLSEDWGLILTELKTSAHHAKLYRAVSVFDTAIMVLQDDLDLDIPPFKSRSTHIYQKHFISRERTAKGLIALIKYILPDVENIRLARTYCMLELAKSVIADEILEIEYDYLKQTSFIISH